ncbi:MAG: cupin domain-containing protein [Terriglobales bacterium]
MKAVDKIIFHSAVLLSGVLAVTWSVSGQELSKRPEKPKERARLLFQRELPKLDSKHLKVTLVEVNYGPGEASAPHSHPCAVFGYVVSGELRTQVKGEPEMIYGAGGTFYEAPNSIHLVSANASTMEPAKLLAYMICDQDAPLTVDLPKTARQKGSAQ